MKKYSKLTRALVNLLIEKVLVSPGERVEVQRKFAEFFDVREGFGAIDALQRKYPDVVIGATAVCS